jgi:hypothetical protein
MPQLLGTLEITAGEGHRQGKFQLFELVFTLGWVGRLTSPVTLIARSS